MPRRAAQALGVQFLFNQTVARLVFAPQTSAPLGVHVRNKAALQRFDAVVMCSSASAVALLQLIGLRLPLVALDCSPLSAPLHGSMDAPVSAALDTCHQVSLMRLGQRLPSQAARNWGAALAVRPMQPR